MIKQFLIIIGFLIAYVVIANTAFSQTKAEIKNVDFTISGDSMIITYDIGKIRDNERFNVSINIKTVSGKTIVPKNLIGEVGENIRGGSKKKVIWNIKNDPQLPDEDIYVEITAKSRLDLEFYKNAAGRRNALWHSAVFPGWGNVQIKGNDKYMFIGIAGYTCLAGGAGCILYGFNTYNKYKSLDDEVQRDKLYSNANLFRKTGVTLLIAAGAIWAGDILLTAMQAKKAGNATALNKKITLGYTYDTAMKRPVMMLRYNF
ncbi:MAG: hypothetical protein HY958_05060 [Bacteroidia bacterium]|nr:hypothetical protein [Bacteroidia bacterium]